VAVPGPRLNIYNAVAANRWRTVALIGAFTGLIAIVGYVGGEYFTPGGGIALLPAALGFSALTSAGSYFAGDKLVLAQSQAKALPADAEPQLRNIVETLAIGLGIEPPKIHLIDDTAPNAFATGRDPKHASIAVTTGLLEKLDRTELERVAGLFTKRTFRRGERIPGRGRKPLGVVLLIEGRLRVVATTMNGRELTVRRHCGGSVAGLGSLLPEVEQRRDLETIAESDGYLAYAPVGEVSALMDQAPRLSRVLLLEAVRQMEDSEEFARRALSSTVAGRVAAALLELDLPAEGAPVLREYLASLAGASRESVSRALHRLAGERMIELRSGGIRITDRPALRRHATPGDAVPCYEGGSEEPRVSICRDDYPFIAHSAE